MTFDLIDVVLIFLLGIALGRWLQVQIIVNNLKNDPRRMIDILERLDNLEDAGNSDEIEIVAEVAQGQVYLWRKDTMTFLGQGNTIEDAVKNISLNYEGNFRIDHETVKRVEAELPK